MAKKIIINIDVNGNCDIKGDGFVGSSCDSLIKEINNLLGETLDSKELPEYRQRENVKPIHKERAKR